MSAVATDRFISIKPKRRQLADVVQFAGGGTPSKGTAAFWGGDVPWVSPKDMKSDVISTSEDKITKAAIEGSATKWIPCDSTLVVVRSGILARTVPICIAGCDLTINQDLKALIPDKSIDPRYLFLFLKSREPELLASVTSSATVHRIATATLESLEIAIPPLAEQKRIVAVLDEAFAALDRARANAEANLADAQSLFDSTLRQTFEARETWRPEALAKRVRFIDYRGMTPPRSDAGIRFITAKNVRMGYIKEDPCEFVPESIYGGWMTRGIPAFGDVLFTTEAPLANVAQLNTAERVVIGQRLITMPTDPTQIVPGFLKWSLMSPQMQHDIRLQGTGATVLGIKAKLLKKITLYVPNDVVEQKRIADACEYAFKKKGELESAYTVKLADIAALRQSLLQKAFAGELS